MARRKRGRRSRKFTLPLAPIAGLAAGMALPIAQAMTGDIHTALLTVSRHYTGIDPLTGRFDIWNLQKGLMPLIMGCLVHKFVGGAPLNVNKVLAAANVPFIRI